jgi:hypothetical protein
MQTNLNDVGSVTVLASKLSRFGHKLESEKAFIMSALSTLGQTFEDEDYDSLKSSFNLISKRMDDLLPQIRIVTLKLVEIYENLKASQAIKF